MSDASTTASVRVSYAEKALLVEAARRRGVCLSDFVRRAALLDAAVVDFVHHGHIRPPVGGAGEGAPAGGLAA